MTDAERPDDASAHRQALLELLLAEEGIDIAGPAIARRELSRPPVLSYAQERMWFLDQFETDTAALGVRVAVDLRGVLDTTALRRSLDEIFRRHDVLRTVILGDSGQPRPVVLQRCEMPLLLEDADGDDAAIASLLAREAARTFDLEHDPPIVVTLIHVTDEHHVLSVVMHHVASDGWSFAVFFRELAALYGAFRDGLPSPLPELAVQYQDYASWQRGSASDVFDRQLSYWREQLAGPLPAFEIPSDHSRPARHSFAGASVSQNLPPDLVAGLSELCRRNGATLFMGLLAGFDVVVSRHVGQTDTLIGTPIAGRVRPELEPMIGAFLNTLVIRTDLTDGPSFQTLLERVRDTTLSAFDNQDVPFELLLAELQPPRDISRTPLFQIFFNMINLDVGAETLALPGLNAAIVEQPDIGSKFDLTMYITDDGGATRLSLVYNRRLFDHDHMDRLVAQYVRVLEQAVAAPETSIDDFSLVTSLDTSVLPDPTSMLDRRWHGSVPASVRRIAARAPERIAVEDAKHVWSYGLLATQMSRLATWLKLRRIGRGDIVAIWAHRSGSLVLTVAGVLASGSVYVLLDPSYPPARLVQLLRIAKPKVWLAVASAGEAPREVIEALDELGVEHRLTVPDFADEGAFEALLDLPAGAAVADAFDTPGDDGIGPDDPACLTFTSGSTGVPKAVVGRHGSLTHFLPWMSEEFEVGEDDRFSMLSGLSHDPIQRDMFWPLWLGATIVIPDPESIASAGWLARWLRDTSVTVAHITPAMGQLMTEGAASRGTTVSSLRVALSIGDVLTRGEVARLRSLAPNVQVVNLYGTTETQRASGYHVVDNEAPEPTETQPREVLPLGKAMPGAQLLVLTSHGQPAAVGEVGEIVMRSPHLALGYLGDEALTATRFRADPFGCSSSDQLYDTGDRGRYRSDGSVEFLGRIDQQVQLRGFRIELGEVQAALRCHESVADAVVVLRDDDPDLPRLVGYVVAEPGHRIDKGELMRSVRSAVPAHMVPADMVEIDRVPLTPNGKVDRRALPAPSVASAASAAGGAPQDSLDRVLVDIWERVLGRKHISVHDDFFALGGYSLLATRVFAMIEDRTGKRLPVSVLFEHPTIAELATLIRSDGWQTNWSSLVPIQASGAGQPFFYVAPYMISVLQLAPLGDELGADRPLYGLQPQGLDGRLPAHRTIEEMAAHYIRELKSVQPDGPYALGGHCSGSWVAFEMARQLEAEGDKINALLLVDQGPPGVERPEINPARYMVNRLRFYFRDGRLRHALAWQFNIIAARLLLHRVGSSTARFQEEVRSVHRHAFRLYRGGQIEQDITLVRSAESLALEDKAWYARWSDRTSGTLTTRNVDGTHANLLVQPYVRQLAAEVVRVMQDDGTKAGQDQRVADEPHRHDPTL
ncbi:MAG: non-ribosomal peptide synthetase [Ilumatobacteraceae bacterium]